MEAYIQTDKTGNYYNVNAYLASVGFRSLGFQIHTYVDAEEVLDTKRESIFVGGVGMIRKRLKHLGIDKPDEIEYPAELRSFLNRKVWKSSLS